MGGNPQPPSVLAQNVEPAERSCDASSRSPDPPINTYERREAVVRWLLASSSINGDEHTQTQPSDEGPDDSGPSHELARGGEEQDRNISVSNAGLDFTACDDGAFYHQFEMIDSLIESNRVNVSDRGVRTPSPTSSGIENRSTIGEEDREDDEVVQQHYERLVEEQTALMEEQTALVEEWGALMEEQRVLIENLLLVEDVRARMDALQEDLERLSSMLPEGSHELLSHFRERIETLWGKLLRAELFFDTIVFADDVRENDVYGDDDGVNDETESTDEVAGEGDIHE